MNRLTIWIFVALVLGPMLAMGFVPAEIARWYAAAGQEAAFSDDAALAMERYGQAIAWAPQNVTWRLMRARLHLAMDDRESAIADCRAAIAIESTNPNDLSRISEVALQLGMVDESLAANRAASEALAWPTQEARATLFNQRAYTLAVANRELSEAKTLADHALDILNRRSIDQANCLDTRGFVHYRMNSHDEALKDFNNAIAAFDQSKKDEEDDRRQRVVDARRFRVFQAGLNYSRAVLLYHRSLAHDKLGHDIEAAIDRSKVKDLGFKPDEKLF